MTEPGHEDVERGAAEENSDAPLTDMEREVSKPPEERWPEHQGSGQADE
jgi:hypothetical protein